MMVDSDFGKNIDVMARIWHENRPSTTVDAVVSLLRDAIVRGDLGAGMPLRQDRIAQKFGISKVPLREALARLEVEGFVVTFPRRGIFVSNLSKKNVEEIFQLRLSIEPDVLWHAVPNLTKEALNEAERLIELFEKADTGELGKLNWLLHKTLYLPSERELSLAILENLHLHADRYVRLHMGMMDRSRKTNDEHREIVAACRRGDRERAVSVLRQHIDGIRMTIHHYVESARE